MFDFSFIKNDRSNETISVRCGEVVFLSVEMEQENHLSLINYTENTPMIIPYTWLHIGKMRLRRI